MEIVRKTIENDEEFLRQVSEEVNFEKDDIQDIIKKLEYYFQTNSCYAMAPVQIGIPKRIIYIKNTKQDMRNNDDHNYNEKRIMINPVILNKKGITEFLEGCESCLDYVGIVERPYQIEVEYYDLKGRKKTEIIEGLESTIFSHEYDHLNGILHLDIAKEIFRMNREETKLYRESHPYRVISKDCEWDEDKNKNK